jgi:hypothetical protein
MTSSKLFPARLSMSWASLWNRCVISEPLIWISVSPTCSPAFSAKLPLFTFKIIKRDQHYFNLTWDNCIRNCNFNVNRMHSSVVGKIWQSERSGHIKIVIAWCCSVKNERIFCNQITHMHRHTCAHTFRTVRGATTSTPPCSRKPHGFSVSDFDIRIERILFWPLDILESIRALVKRF